LNECIDIDLQAAEKNFSLAAVDFAKPPTAGGLFDFPGHRRLFRLVLQTQCRKVIRIAALAT